MDERYRKLERDFHANRDYETACELIHLDYRLGNWRLREQADRFDISYEDAWDCASYYHLGYTQSLVDAANLALEEEGITSKEQESQIYTNRSGPNSLLREATTLAKSNEYLHSWKSVRIPNIITIRRSGPAWVSSIHLFDDPIYDELPSLMFLSIPHETGATNTTAIYIREPKEISRIIHALHIISLMIHQEIPHSPNTWAREYDLEGNNRRYIDNVEQVLRDLGVLGEEPKNINR